MEPVDPMSYASASAEDTAEPQAPTPLTASGLVTERSRKRTHAVPLERAESPGRRGHQSRTDPHERISPSKRAKPSSQRRAQLSQPRKARKAQTRTEEAAGDIAAPHVAREAHHGAEDVRPAVVALGAEDIRPTEVPLTEVALKVHRGHVSAPNFLVIGVRRRVRGAIMTISTASALSRWRKSSGQVSLTQKRRSPPLWVWAPLNVLAILLVAQACIVSEVESSAINKAVAPFFQAFVGAQPYIIHPGPTPRPVHTPATFIATMLPYARHASQTLHWPVSVILAQWGVEHGWSLPDFDGWNVGNTRPFNSPSGVCYGAPVVRDFCAPKTPELGLAIYIHAAQLHYYSGIAAAASQGGPNAAAHALGASPWDAGHYTSDNSPGDSLLHAMQAFNLYRYDT